LLIPEEAGVQKTNTDPEIIDSIDPLRARVPDALKRNVDAEMDAAFHRNVAKAKANRKARST
jgi:hypothetical protein